MFTIVLAIVLLFALFALTIQWAFSHLKALSREEAPSELLNARLWAAGTSLLVLLVFIAAAIGGLLRSNVQGVERLLAGLSWGPVQVALAVCAAMVIVPLGFSVRALVRRDWTVGARLQMAVYATTLAVVVGLLLSLALTT